jgi:hypothetical protein
MKTVECERLLNQAVKIAVNRYQDDCALQRIISNA